MWKKFYMRKQLKCIWVTRDWKKNKYSPNSGAPFGAYRLLCPDSVSWVKWLAETLLQKSFEHRSTNKVIFQKLMKFLKCFWAQFIAEALGVILTKFQIFPITSLKYAGSWSLKVKVCQNRKLRRPFSHAILASI